MFLNISFYPSKPRSRPTDRHRVYDLLLDFYISIFAYLLTRREINPLHQDRKRTHEYQSKTRNEGMISEVLNCANFVVKNALFSPSVQSTNPVRKDGMNNTRRPSFTTSLCLLTVFVPLHSGDPHRKKKKKRCYHLFPMNLFTRRLLRTDYFGRGTAFSLVLLP